MDDKEKDLKYFKNLNYHIEVIKKNGKFILYIPELSLFEEDETFERAYDKLESEKEKYFLKMIDMEAQDEIVEPAYLGRKAIKKILHSLIPFFIKLLATSAIVVAILASIDEISSTFKYFKRASKNVSRIDFSQMSQDFMPAAKDFEQASNNFLQADNTRRPAAKGHLFEDIDVEQTVFQVLNALEKHEILKEEIEFLSSKCEPVSPDNILASNSLDDHPTELAFDSNIFTFWHSSKSEAFFTVSFRHPTQLQALSLTLRQDVPAGMQGPDEVTIEGSSDGSSWEDLKGASPLVWKRGETKRIFLKKNSSDYAHYKLNFKKYGREKNFISISEVNLYKSKK